MNIDMKNTGLPCEKETFDCIIIENEFEHMIEPEQVLIRLKKYLKEDGFLIYFIPTLRWHSRMSILPGKFDYEDGTVFDIAKKQ